MTAVGGLTQGALKNRSSVPQWNVFLYSQGQEESSSEEEEGTDWMKNGKSCLCTQREGRHVLYLRHGLSVFISD